MIHLIHEQLIPNRHAKLGALNRITRRVVSLIPELQATRRAATTTGKSHGASENSTHLDLPIDVGCFWATGSYRRLSVVLKRICWKVPAQSFWMLFWDF